MRTIFCAITKLNLYHIILPTLLILYRRKIESAHSSEMEQLRKTYSWEDKEKLIGAKKSFESDLKLENLAQEPKEKGQLPGKLGMFSLSLSL